MNVREVWDGHDVSSFTSTKVGSRETRVCGLFYDVLRELGVHKRYCARTMPAVTGTVFQRGGTLTKATAFARPSGVFFVQGLESEVLDEDLFLDSLERLWALRNYDHPGLNVELTRAEAGAQPGSVDGDVGCLSPPETK